ncbi:MAG: thioredoxin domain-containing protein [Pseudomonadota bacterium]
MSIFRTSTLAATLLFLTTACSEGGDSSAQQTSGEETSDGLISEASFDAGVGVQIGAVDAPVTIIEYASITCNHCKDFHDDVVGSVFENYVAAGKVKFVFREFPLNQIDVAGFAVARCAGEANYFSALDVFFDEQAEVISAAQDGTILDKFKDIGAGFGLDEDEVDTCINDSDIRRQIAASIDAGQGDGVNSTPSIFINGTRQETIESRTAEGMANILDGLLGETSEPETAAEPTTDAADTSNETE